MKAKGMIFNHRIQPTHRHLKLEIKESTKKFNQDWGHRMPLQKFLACCESGCFIDYDGYAKEMLLDGNIVCSESISPSDALFFKKKIQTRCKSHQNLEIIWYNR